MKPPTNETRDCVKMNLAIRQYLSREFPETSVDIAILVLLRIAVDTAVKVGGRERAPAMISRLTNHFLITDHYDDRNW